MTKPKQPTVTCTNAACEAIIRVPTGAKLASARCPSCGADVEALQPHAEPPAPEAEQKE